MGIIAGRPAALCAIAMLVVPVASTLSAQQLEPADAAEATIDVYGSLPDDLSGLAQGPAIEGFISARTGRTMQVTTADGISTVLGISDATEIRTTGGFLGLNRQEIAAESLFAGVPVRVDTVEWGEGLVASRIRFKNSDLRNAAMIHNATAERFGAHEIAITENTAATEALRGRISDIDQYNIVGTANAYFDTGKWQLSPQAERELCAAASDAEEMNNALLLVVGYTDSVGDRDYNQGLSERRAGRVVNHLQQECGWAPYRMLTPAGMAEADPAADNSTAEGRAQNRRVAVNILVSKAVEGL